MVRCLTATALGSLALAALPITVAGETSPAGELSCIILPDEQIDVSSPVAGVIEELMVRRSDRVARGQVLARMEASVEQATLALARARATRDSELELRRVELRYDQQHRDRLKTLHDRSVVSSQNRDDGERAADAALLRMRIAEEQMREARLEQRRADAVLALKTIRSPIDGVVVQEHRTAGEYVENQPIVRVVRLDPLRVEVIAPLALFGSIEAGMRMRIHPETDPDREHVAIVTAVDPIADPGSGMFGVELELPNPDLALPAGIKCRGRLLPDQVVEGGDAGPHVAASVASETPPGPPAVVEDRQQAPRAGPRNALDGDSPSRARPPTATVLGAAATKAASDANTSENGAPAPAHPDRIADLRTLTIDEVHGTSTDRAARPAPATTLPVALDATVDAARGADDSNAMWPAPPAATGGAGEAVPGSVADGREAVTITSGLGASLITLAPNACIAYEGIDAHEGAEAIASTGEQLGAHIRITASSEVRTIGYLVLAAQASDREASRALNDRLRAAGITDIAVLARGPHAGRIALGAYSGAQWADRRRAALAELGFPTEVEPRMRTERTWNVALHLPPGLEPDSAHRTVSDSIGVPAPATCEPLRTAAR